MVFRDRVDGGRRLAAALEFLKGTEGLLVLGIPRGGVVTAAEVAKELHADLDVWLARKIGSPYNPEFAVGSVSIDGEVNLDRHTVEMLHIPDTYLASAIEKEKQELQRRMIAYRGSDHPVDVRGRTVVLVDDGIATGSTAISALMSLKHAGAARRVLAVPVAPLDSISRLEESADQVVVIHAAPDFYAVGQFYDSFDQVSDEEVIELLESMRHHESGI
jgi:putative phosphoribosyl transferase